MDFVAGFVKARYHYQIKWSLIHALSAIHLRAPEDYITFQHILVTPSKLSMFVRLKPIINEILENIYKR